MEKFHLVLSSAPMFEKLIIEVMEGGTYNEEYGRYFDAKYLGYIHTENPDNYDEQYIVFTASIPSADDKGLKGGTRLADFVTFISDIDAMIEKKMSEPNPYV